MDENAWADVGERITRYLLGADSDLIEWSKIFQKNLRTNIIKIMQATLTR